MFPSVKPLNRGGDWTPEVSLAATIAADHSRTIGTNVTM